MVRETLGKPFRKKSSGGKFAKGTLIQYKYVGNKKIATVKAKK